MYFLLFKIFEQLALALKTECVLKIFKPGGASASPDPPSRTPVCEAYGSLKIDVASPPPN